MSASSPSCRSTDPKGVVSRALLRANAAGPRRSDGAAFWQADLGAGHALMCNYYTMRHDASPHYPRSWALQVTHYFCHACFCLPVCVRSVLTTGMRQ